MQWSLSLCLDISFSPLVRCSPGCRRRCAWSCLHTCSPYTCQSQQSWCGPRSPASRCRASDPCSRDRLWAFVHMHVFRSGFVTTLILVVCCCQSSLSSLEMNIESMFICLLHTSYAGKQTIISWPEIIFSLILLPLCRSYNSVCVSACVSCLNSSFSSPHSPPLAAISVTK